MKKLSVTLFVFCLLLSFSTALLAARLWNASEIRVGTGSVFNCGQSPTIALLYGVQPVVSNFNSQAGSVLHKTAFGWESYMLSPGYIDGDGASRVVSYPYPVQYGQDGEFYSVSGLKPISLSGGVGPVWGFSSSGWCSVSADTSGVVYMASGRYLAHVFGAGWSTSVDLGPYGITSVCDLAISPYGDIAVSGYSSNYALVAWYDHKWGWRSRSLYVPTMGIVDIEWDQKGNLGVAYAYPGIVVFDYLDMGNDSWTTEVVNTISFNYQGAALAFDRFGNPVIAAGTYLFYDPSAGSIALPEPANLSATINLLDYTAGASKVGVVVDVIENDAIVKTVNVFADGAGRIAITAPLGTFDVAIKGTSSLRKVVRNVTISADSITDLGVIDLINGDLDGDNEITSTDLSILGLNLGLAGE